MNSPQRNEHRQGLLRFFAEDFLEEERRDGNPTIYDFFFRCRPVQWFHQSSRKSTPESHSREVRDVGQNIEHCADAESKRPRNLQCADRIFDVIQHIIEVRPPCVRVDHFEHCRCILDLVSALGRGSTSSTYVVAAMRATRERIPEVDMWVFNARVTGKNRPAFEQVSK